MCKLKCIQPMEYYSALKRNQILSHEKTWRDLIFMILGERSQSEKATYCMIPIYDILEKANYGVNKKISGYQGLGWGKR